MKAAGTWTFCYAVVSNTDVWRSINPASLSGAMNLELARRGFIVGSGPSNISNSLVVSFRQLAHILDTYETVLQVWFTAPNPFDERNIHACFVRAWNQTVSPQYPFPHSPSLNDSIDDINGGRLRILPYAGYSQIDCDMVQYVSNPPLFGSTSVVDRATMSAILTSNQPSLVGREVNPLEIAAAANRAISSAGRIASDAVDRAATYAREQLGNLADYGTSALQRSGLLPFTTNELQTIGSAVAVIGIAAVATYALGKAK